MLEFLRQLITGLFGKDKVNPIPVSTPGSGPIPVPAPTTKPRSSYRVDKTGSRPWVGVVLHHSAGVDGATRDTDEIIKYHTSYRIDYTPVTAEEFYQRKAAGQGKHFEEPWRAVGYNFLLEKVNGVYTVNVGRSLAMVGAHAGHPKSNIYNEQYIGVCVIGNFDNEVPSKETIEFTLAFIRTLMDSFGFGSDAVLGHRETFDRLGVPREKECPGRLFDMGAFRGSL